MFFWPYPKACGIWVPDQASNLSSLHWKHGVLTTGPLGKSPLGFFDDVTWANETWRSQAEFLHCMYVINCMAHPASVYFTGCHQMDTLLWNNLPNLGLPSLLLHCPKRQIKIVVGREKANSSVLAIRNEWMRMSLKVGKVAPSHHSHLRATLFCCCVCILAPLPPTIGLEWSQDCDHWHAFHFTPR